MSEEFKNNLPNNDDYVIGKGFEVEEIEITEKPKRYKKKAKNGLKTTISIILIFVISIGLGFGIIYAGADYLGVGFGRGEDVVIDVTPGSSATKIAEQLHECGAVKIPILFRVYAKLKGYENQFKYGLYEFDS